MSQADSALTPTLPFPTSLGTIRRRPSRPCPVPSAVAHGTWFIPIIDHPGRVASYIRFSRFPRKAKPTAAAAIAYAGNVIGWREIRENEKRRRLEGLSSPHWLQAAE